MPLLQNQPLYPARINTDHPAIVGSSAQVIGYGDAAQWARNAGALIAQPTVGGTAPTFATTPIGSGIVFNGTDNYIDYGTANIPTQEFTFLWGGIFTAVDNFRGLIDCVSGANGWTIFQSGTDTLFFSINGYGGATSLGGWTAGQFWHGAVRWKTGGEHAWFRNGIKQSSINSVLVPGTSIASLRIGWQRGGGVVPLKGPLAYGYLLDKWLGDDLIISLHANPWQIFESEPEVVFYPAAASGASGTVNAANASDTSSASGTTTVTGTVARGNASDSVSGSGTTTVTGSLAKTNASDTCSASGSIGSAVSGSLAYTNASDTSAASGTTTVTGSLAKTNAGDSVSASGTTAVKGSVAKTNVNDSVSASGAVGSAVSGSVNRTNASDTPAASGSTTVTGSLARTSANDTASSAGTTTVIASLAYVESRDSLASSGVVGSVSGSLVLTLDSDICVAAGVVGTITEITSIVDRTAVFNPVLDFNAQFNPSKSVQTRFN
jgi:hypothetical protein